ncbi:hypothetical protein M407DRAFT_244223, partial [Tulasnella calospora MUT 4182]
MGWVELLDWKSRRGSIPFSQNLGGKTQARSVAINSCNNALPLSRSSFVLDPSRKSSLW